MMVDPLIWRCTILRRVGLQGFRVCSKGVYRDNSLIKNTHPSRTTIEP